RETLLHVVHDGGEVARARLEAHVDPPRVVFARDLVRRGQDAHVGHVLQANVVAARRVDQEPSNARQAGADVGHAPDDHVVDLGVAVDVADLVAGDQCRRGSAYVTGLQADPGRLGQIRQHLYVWHVEGELRVQAFDPRNGRESVLHLGRLGAKAPEVRAEDSYD